MTEPATVPTPTPVTEQLHGCVRCGAPVPIDVAMCERCNPLALAQPAASQAHGTVFLGVGLAVVGLAILANFAVSGIGPFKATIASVVADPPGLNVTLSVTNSGSRAGATTCRVYEASLGIGPDTPLIQTPRIDAGATITFNRRITGIDSDVLELAVQCRDL
jgi:hypothetical protein